jgi:hypothetical protein
MLHPNHLKKMKLGCRFNPAAFALRNLSASLLPGR